MRKILILPVFIISILFAKGQSDQQAVKILDAFSSKATSAPSVSMKFNLITVDQMEKTTDTIKGSVVLKGDMYRLDLPGNTIFFDGVNSYSYLPAEKEVTITKPEKTDNSFETRPSSIFSIYKKDYKSRLIEERTGSYVIDLYPEDIKSEIIRIRLLIGKPQLNLISLEYKRRDGVSMILDVLDYNLKQTVTPDTFTFRKENYKDVEVIDMR
jgi:outer membrane lipoprotein-sorting protein